MAKTATRDQTEYLLWLVEHGEFCPRKVPIFALNDATATVFTRFCRLFYPHESDRTISQNICICVTDHVDLSN